MTGSRENEWPDRSKEDQSNNTDTVENSVHLAKRELQVVSGRKPADRSPISNS
jgi:hypothetical protein